jgi:hypothetical protein
MPYPPETALSHGWPRRMVLLAGILFCLPGLGCGGSSEAKYLPATSAARAALEKSLNAWKSGQPQDSVKANEIVVQTFDARWRDGAKLEAFEILTEESLEGRPAFKVRIAIQKAQPIEDLFVVVGNNPLLVFRKQDFDKAGGN